MDTQDKEKSDDVRLPIRISPELVEMKGILGSGPGGQHVQKSHSTIDARISLRKLGLSEQQIKRVRQHPETRKKIDKNDELRIKVNEGRSEKDNRDKAVRRIEGLLNRALEISKERIATKPTMASKKRRRREEERHSEKKKERAKSRDYKIR